MFDRAKKGWKPPRPQKARISFSLSPEVLKEFEQFCNDNDYKRNELIECILEDFLNKYGTSD